MRGRISGGWIYVAVVFCTLVWALWEVGGNGWALVPRVVAPIVLLILVIFAMAALSGRPRRWRLALASSGLVVLLAVASGAMLGWLNSARPLQQLPASRWAMADPALMRSEEHTSELQSLMRISYAVFCLKQNKQT